MVVLKKVKASTLIETLVATVLIVVVFMLSSMILNNLFSNTIKNNTRIIEAHLNELEYLQKHNKLSLPYDGVFESWTINIEQVLEKGQYTVEIEAVNTSTNKTIVKSYYAAN